MTLQQIKDSLPKYITLTSPSEAKEGDTVAETIKEVGSRGGEILYEDCEVILRPIPDEVLENQAFLVMWHKLATVPARLDLDRWELHMHKGGLTASLNEGFSYPEGEIGEYELHQRNGFESKEKALAAIPILGGEQNIIKHLSAGDLYSKWLGEQLT